MEYCHFAMFWQRARPWFPGPLGHRKCSVCCHYYTTQFIVRSCPIHTVAGSYFLGSIDPSLYKLNDEDDDYEIPDGHIGRVWFAVEYERESEKLLVTLIKAKNLPSRSLSHTGSCDPFVRYIMIKFPGLEWQSGRVYASVFVRMHIRK